MADLVRSIAHLIPATSLKMLVGNMSDKGKITVSMANIDSLVRDYGMRYVEVSAKQCYNIDRVYYT